MFNEMKSTLIAGALVALLAGCQQAETPAEVRDDVADAQVEAQQDLSQTQAAAYEETALTRAEGEHKIAIETCEALAGDEQKLCKDQAHATLDAAKKAAEQPGT